MFEASTYSERRNLLSNSSLKGLILICGNSHTPRNYSSNTYPFRQDSNFLYFAGIDLPNMNLTIDTNTGITTLYADDITVEDAIWSGDQPAMTEWAKKSGIDKVKPSGQLSIDLQQAKLVHYLPPYPYNRQLWLSEIFNKNVTEIKQGVSIELIKAVVKLRSKKSKEEVAQIENALNIATSKMHIKAMQMALPGAMEYEIVAAMNNIIQSNNCTPAYGTICSIHGETLHNEYYNNKLEKDQLLLIDAGAENPMHYASDITRTTPVGGVFNQQHKQIYSLVLDALNTSILAIKPGITYREIHLNAAKLMAQGLKDMGLMKGDIDTAVSKGAHALFFPHGLGHMMGLDVHDMEDLGEDYVGYTDSIKRSEQFGTAFLRLAKELEEGFVITVEPGLYFIPKLIQQWKAEKKHNDFINYQELEKFSGFGGIRIEDNVLITNSGRKVLGEPIAKSTSEIENIF